MKKYFLLAVLFLGSGSVFSAMAKTDDKATKAEEVVAAKVEEVKAEKIEEVKAAKIEEVKAAKVEEVKAAPVDDRLAALRQRMANNASLKDADQAALAAAMAAHYASGADLRAPENEKAMLFFEGTANDPNMKVNEKLELIKKYDPKAVAVEKLAVETDAPVKTVAKAEEVKAVVKTEKKAGGFSFFNKK